MLLEEWYLEYKIKSDFPGLLGSISSLLGSLSMNITGIIGTKSIRQIRFLVEKEYNIQQLSMSLKKIDAIDVLHIRKSEISDKQMIQQKKLENCFLEEDIYRFERKDLGLLVQFLGEIFQGNKNQLIGVRGMPRVGKTESIIASSVCANKRWLLLSSTLLKQTVRNQLMKEEYDVNNIFIIDGIVSTQRTNERHMQLIREIMATASVKVVEHPDIFVQHSSYSLSDFDYIIELREYADQQITYIT